MAELRPALLQRIHDQLDDDHARSVYADHLLELGGADAWHGELIRLQLDGGDPQRIAALLATHKTRALGPLVRLFEVSWVRGFPERARTRRWTEEHVTRLVESRHLPTLRSLELAHVTATLLPSLLAAPRVVTERVTELIVADASLADVAELLASDRFPALRVFGLRRDARTMPLYPNTDILAAVFASPLVAQLTRLGIWCLPGDRARWVTLAPPSLAQLDLYEYEYDSYTESATSYVRGPAGVLVEASDPVIPLAAKMGFYHFTSIDHVVDGWPRERLLALEQRLIAAGHDDEAGWVRELIDDPDPAS